MKRWKKVLTALAVAGSFSLLAHAAASAADGAAFKKGEAAYENNCAKCHGLRGAGGTDKGPPLVHRIYEPNHHGDANFRLAVRRGVRSHHWSFGDMQPQPGVGEDEVESIIVYIRKLQRDAGIY